MEENQQNQIIIDSEEQKRVDNLPYRIPSALRHILDGFKWAITKKNQSAVMIVDGRSGMGKTTLSLQCAKYMSPDFSLKDVYFSPEKFLEGLANTEKGTRKTLVFDEAMLLSSRAALSAMNRMIVIAMSMIRSKNLFIIFKVNSIFDLDRNLALSRADLLLHCYGESLTDKGKFLAFFKGADGIDRIKELYIHGKKFYSYGYPKSNFNTTFSSEFVVDEDEYERLKQIGVNKFLKGQKNSENTKYKLQRNALFKIIREKIDITYQELEKLLNEKGVKLNFSQISRICNEKESNFGNFEDI